MSDESAMDAAFAEVEAKWRWDEAILRGACRETLATIPEDVKLLERYPEPGWAEMVSTLMPGDPFRAILEEVAAGGPLPPLVDEFTNALCWLHFVLEGKRARARADAGQP